MDDAGLCVSAAVAAGMAPAVALFRSLGDETRLKIVRRLAGGEARIVDLTGELGLAQSTVSKHVACLRDCGLVDFRVEGRQSFYSLSRPELLDLLTAAEAVLAATGSAVSLCPEYAVPDRYAASDRYAVPDTYPASDRHAARDRAGSAGAR